MILGTKPKTRRVRVQIIEQEGNVPVPGRSKTFTVYELSFEEIVLKINCELVKLCDNNSNQPGGNSEKSERK